MKKIVIGLAITTFALVIVASVFAFSLSLYSLRVNATTFHGVAAPAIQYAPMTSSDEGAMLANSVGDEPQAQVELTEKHTTCQKRYEWMENHLGF